MRHICREPVVVAHDALRAVDDQDAVRRRFERGLEQRVGMAQHVLGVLAGA